MILYHGSSVGNITTLQPNLADHSVPYIYMATLEVVAGFYIFNAVERPYYWFPYGFEKDGMVHYQEWYPNALQEVYGGKVGYIYTVETTEENVLPLQGIPCARLGTIPMQVKDYLKISDCYEWFMRQEKDGAFILKRYEDKTKEQIAFFSNQLIQSISEKKLIENPECSYAKFIQNKFPQVWERYVGQLCNV